MPVELLKQAEEPERGENVFLFNFVSSVCQLSFFSSVVLYSFKSYPLAVCSPEGLFLALRNLYLNGFNSPIYPDKFQTTCQPSNLLCSPPSFGAAHSAVLKLS